jgi:hypothetical protein
MPRTTRKRTATAAAPAAAPKRARAARPAASVAATGVGTAAKPSPQAAALLRLLGKGYTYRNYPTTGPVRELRLHNGGPGIAYVVQAKGATVVTVRYPQHGFNFRAQTVNRALAQRTKTAHAAWLAAVAKRNGARR